MKLMDRYIIRELLVPFIAGSIAIALLFDANQLIYILKSFNNVPPLAILQMIVYQTPSWLNLTLPAGISLAASLAVTRLSRESEITAMRAVGTRVVRVILPIAVFGIVVAIGNYLLVELVIPITSPKARRLEIETGIASSSTYQTNVWLNLKQYRATFGSIKAGANDTLVAKNVVLGERPEANVTVFTFGDEASYNKGIWTIPNPLIYRLDAKGAHIEEISKGDDGKPSALTINQPIFVSDLFDQAMPQDRTAADLAKAINEGKGLGRDTTRDEIEYYTRFSIPAACIVFAIIAPIFAVTFAKTGSFVGVLLSIILVLLYYNAFVISKEIFGRNHWVAPWVAAWFPNFAFAALGLLGVRKLE